MTYDKARENQLRRLLSKGGYLLRKSRRAVSLDNLGHYMIVDGNTGCVVRGERFDYTLEDVEQFLND